MSLIQSESLPGIITAAFTPQELRAASRGLIPVRERVSPELAALLELNETCVSVGIPAIDARERT
jgi:hypothetical protein